MNNPIYNSIKGNLRKDNTTGIAGVCWVNHYQKYHVRISNKHLAYTVDFFEACCIRKSKENNHVNSN